MRYFSYNDYMDYVENGEINEINRVSENIAKYEVKNNEENAVINRIIDILKDKEELKKLLKYFLKLKETNELLYCDKVKPSFSKENNYIICKLLNKEIFIYIKVIEKKNNNISFMMFEDSMDIIKKWNEHEKRKQKRYPIVIPVVIYIGKEKWKNNNQKNNKLKYMICEDNRINFAYNMIKINEIKIKDLIELKSQLSKELLNIKINIYK